MQFISSKKITLFLVGLFLAVSLVGSAGILSAQTGTTIFPEITGEDADVNSDVLSGTLRNIGRGTETFAVIVNLLTTIAVSAAFLYFFYNLYQYIKTADAEGKEEAKGKMGWSLLAIIVITSLWGIIGYVRSVAGIDGDAPANVVTVPGTGFLGAPSNQQAPNIPGSSGTNTGTGGQGAGLNF